jgi:hypothetical protein
MNKFTKALLAATFLNLVWTGEQANAECMSKISQTQETPLAATIDLLKSVAQGYRNYNDPGDPARMGHFQGYADSIDKLCQYLPALETKEKRDFVKDREDRMSLRDRILNGIDYIEMNVLLVNPKRAIAVTFLKDVSDDLLFGNLKIKREAPSP